MSSNKLGIDQDSTFRPTAVFYVLGEIVGE